MVLVKKCEHRKVELRRFYFVLHTGMERHDSKFLLMN